MNVLISMKPKYADKIMSGKKAYEFRRTIFTRRYVEKMFIYSSTPVKKIIGVVDIDEIIEGTPKQLWEKCYRHGGIPKFYFFKYFANKERGYAIKMKNIKKYGLPVDPWIDPKFKPPQNFYYINDPIKGL